MLAHLLGAHPQIFSKGETWLMLALRKFGQIPAFHEFGNWHTAVATQEFLKDVGEDAVPAIARMLYGRALPEGKKVFLDKTPRYYWISDWLYSQFPDAHFVVLQRDPLDVAASMKTTWNDRVAHETIFSNQSSTVFDLLLGHEMIAEFASRHANDPRVHVVQYEDIVRDPSGECGRLLEAFQLADTHFSEDWLTVDPGRLSGSFGDPKIHQTDRVHSASVNRAREALTEEEHVFLSAYYHKHELAADDPWAEKVFVTHQQALLLLQERRFMEHAFLSVGEHNRDADAIGRSVFAQVAGIPGLSEVADQGFADAGLPGPWPPLASGETVTVEDGARFARCLGEGWHAPESSGIWSSQERSVIALRLAANVRAVRLKLSDGISDWRPGATFWARQLGQGVTPESGAIRLGKEPSWQEFQVGGHRGTAFLELGCAERFVPAERGYEPPDDRPLCVLLHAISAD